MAENPDRNHPNTATLAPVPGEVRFVERALDDHGVPKKGRILQRWEYSYIDGKWNWYDVPNAGKG